MLTWPRWDKRPPPTCKPDSTRNTARAMTASLRRTSRENTPRTSCGHMHCSFWTWEEENAALDERVRIRERTDAARARATSLCARAEATGAKELALKYRQLPRLTPLMFPTSFAVTFLKPSICLRGQSAFASSHIISTTTGSDAPRLLGVNLFDCGAEPRKQRRRFPPRPSPGAHNREVPVIHAHRPGVSSAVTSVFRSPAARAEAEQLHPNNPVAYRDQRLLISPNKRRVCSRSLAFSTGAGRWLARERASDRTVLK